MTDFERQLIRAFAENSPKGIKNIEIALQAVIEKNYPDKCWWETCNVNIYMELLNCIPPPVLVDKIVKECESKVN